MKTILAVLLAAAFISCNNNEKELLAFEEMDKGFMSANAVIDGANKKIFADFESKLQDFKSAYKAAIWTQSRQCRYDG